MVGEAADSLHQGGIGFVRTRRVLRNKANWGGRWVCLCKTLSLSPAACFYETKPIDSGALALFVQMPLVYIQLSEIVGGRASCEDAPGGFCETKPNPGAAPFGSPYFPGQCSLGVGWPELAGLELVFCLCELWVKIGERKL
jgi:hypothetical protein